MMHFQNKADTACQAHIWLLFRSHERVNWNFSLGRVLRLSWRQEFLQRVSIFQIAINISDGMELRIYRIRKHYVLPKKLQKRTKCACKAARYANLYYKFHVIRFILLKSDYFVFMYTILHTWTFPVWKIDTCNCKKQISLVW